MGETIWNVSATDGRHLAPDLIDPTNYAGNPEVEKRVVEDIIELYPSVRGQRMKKEERWKRYIGVYEGDYDIKYYEGQADLKLRMARKVVDTVAAHTKAQIWPENQFFIIEPGPDPMAAQKVEIIKALLKHDIEQARLRDLTDLFLVNAFVYGPSILKTYWQVKRSSIVRRRQIRGTVQNIREPLVLYEGPRTDVVDPFRVYIHPITARSIDDARIIYEDIEVSKAFLKSMEKAGVYKNVSKVLKAAGSVKGPSLSDIDANRDQRSSPEGYNVSGGVNDQKTVRITEVWAQFDLYGRGEEIPCKITFSGENIIEVRANPFFSQRPPYRMWRGFDKTDDVYGQSLMSLIEDYQYGIDALLNASVDAINFQINSIIYVNADMMEADSIKIKPRAIWYGNGRAREAFDIVRPPDTTGPAMQMLLMLIQWMETIASAQPVQQGRVGKSGTTATEVAAVASSAGAFTSGTVSRIESNVLSPLITDYYMLEQQFRALDSHVKITGQLPINIEPQDLVGDYMFRWYVSQEAAQRMQLMQFDGGMTAVPANGQGGEGGGDAQQLLSALMQGGGGGE